MKWPKVACAMMFLPIAHAALAQKAGSYTTRRGETYSYTAQAGNGMATGSVTGPRGNTTEGSASATYAGGGNYAVSGTVQGPRGVTRHRTAIVNPY